MTFLKRALATAADVKHIIRSEPVHPEYEYHCCLSIKTCRLLFLLLVNNSFQHQTGASSDGQRKQSGNCLSPIFNYDHRIDILRDMWKGSGIHSGFSRLQIIEVFIERYSLKEYQKLQCEHVISH